MVLGFKDLMPDDTVTENDLTVRNGTHLLRYSGKAERITVPEGITDICDDAFRNCSNLISVKLPESTEFIRRGAFFGCCSLRTISVPECLIGIGSRAFSSCTGLIEFRAYKCSEKTKSRAAVKSSYNAPCIGKEAFLGCTSLRYADIPGFRMIEERAFAECSGLTGINLPEILHSVGKNAFFGCKSLRKITVPASAAVIADDAFENCPALEYIDVSEKNRTFISVDGMLCSRSPGVPEGSGFNILTVPEGKSGEADISAEICSLGRRSFRGCRLISKVNVPKSVLRIGSGAFLNCTGLSEVYINGSTVRRIEKDAFLGCENASVYVMSADGNVRFRLDLKEHSELRSLEWNNIELDYPQVLFTRIRDKAAKISIVLSCLSYRNIPTENMKNYYRNYILSCPGDSVRYAVDRSDIGYLEICLSCGAARRGNIDSYISYSSEKARTECTAYLMQYKKDHFSDGGGDTNLWDTSDPDGDYAIDLGLDLGDLNEL